MRLLRSAIPLRAGQSNSRRRVASFFTCTRNPTSADYLGRRPSTVRGSPCRLSWPGAARWWQMVTDVRPRRKIRTQKGGSHRRPCSRTAIPRRWRGRSVWPPPQFSLRRALLPLSCRRADLRVARYTSGSRVGTLRECSVQTGLYPSGNLEFALSRHCNYGIE
jgi:hypothetical protein